MDDTRGDIILNCLAGIPLHMAHARRPTHDIERWSVGTIEHIRERDGHCVFDVQTAGAIRSNSSSRLRFES